MQTIINCTRHGTSTLIEVGADAQYRARPPVEHICTMCKRELSDPEEHTGTRTPDAVIVHGHSDGIILQVPGEERRAREAELDAIFEERQRARGVVIPGSAEEMEALAQMDYARVDAVERDRRHSRRTREQDRLARLSYHVPTRGWVR